jgi:hypothetical protein
MFRNRKIYAAMAMVLILALIPLGIAQAVTYTSGFQIQNLTSTTANISIVFYDQAGVAQATVPDTISGDSSKTYFPLSAVSVGFNGSVVVSSDQNVAAIANVLGDGGNMGASYGGFSSGATTVNLPLVMKENYGINTWFNVQNAGSSAATVNVTYAGSPAPSGGCPDSASVEPGAAATFDQSTDSCLASGFVGAATLTSSEPIVATVMQVSAESLLAYTGFTTASTAPQMPLILSGYYNAGTGIQIQNTGGTATDVTISYTPSSGFPGAACTETKSISPGASTTFAFPSMPVSCYTDGGSAGSDAFVGSGKVTGNTTSQDLVAIVNQITFGDANQAAYNAVDPATATNKVSLPLIMDRNYGIFTGISIANVGSSATDITCTFSGTSYTASATGVAPGAALTDVQLNQIADGYVGSATCTASGGDELIAGIVNELTNGSPTNVDGLLTYEGFNY